MGDPHTTSPAQLLPHDHPHLRSMQISLSTREGGGRRHGRPGISCVGWRDLEVVDREVWLAGELDDGGDIEERKVQLLTKVYTVFGREGGKVGGRKERRKDKREGGRKGGKLMHIRWRGWQYLAHSR